MSTEEPLAAEPLIWTGKSSHWQFFGRWVTGTLVAAALTVLPVLFRQDIAKAAPSAFPWVYLLPVLVLAWVFGSVSIERARQRYSITAKRVIMETGLFARSSNEIRVQDIRSINVAKSGLGGMFGIGNVEFSSAATDDADVIFYKIAGADEVRDIVRKLQS